MPEPGPLAQEAALLAAAVREWLTTHGTVPLDVPEGTVPPDVPEGTVPPGQADEDLVTFDEADRPGASGHAGSSSTRPGGHESPPGSRPEPEPRVGPPWAVAPGETLCTGCPLCRLLASVAGSHAEVVGHLLAAASSLAAAARAAWPAVGVPGQDPSGQRFDPSAWRASPSQTATQRTRPARDRVQRIDIGE